MTSRRGGKLAERMQRKLEEEEVRKAREEEARQAVLARARAERERLFEDLEAFAGVLDSVHCGQHGEALVLRRGERFVQFEPMGTAERVRVSFTGSEGEDHRFYQEANLSNRWVWAHSGKRRSEERVPLFDEGLERLMVRALELPPVLGSDPVPSSPTDPFEAFGAAEEQESPPTGVPRGKRNL